MEHISTRSTSPNTAAATNIILREGDQTRLIFRPELVNNEKNEEASVRGTFIYQRKKKKDEWEDASELKLNQLKASEGIKLELHSREVLDLFNALADLYQIYKVEGIKAGKHDFVDVSDENIQKLIENADLIAGLIQKDGPELFKKVLTWMSGIENLEGYLDKIAELNIDQLNTINTVVGLVNLKNALRIWEMEKANPDEEFWQGFLKANAWVISQVFCAPIFIYEDKAFLGGKALDNKGGKVIDYVYANGLTHNLTLIEIKTPSTLLLGAEYRNDIYSMSSDLTGAINQTLNYKDQLQKNYYALANESEEPFEVFNPKCLIISGSIEELNDKNKIRSFELSRNDLKSIEIITFDELFQKVASLIKLLESPANA